MIRLKYYITFRSLQDDIKAEAFFSVFNLDDKKIIETFLEIKSQYPSPWVCCASGNI